MDFISISLISSIIISPPRYDKITQQKLDVRYEECITSYKLNSSLFPLYKLYLQKKLDSCKLIYIPKL